jgi:hypothetical protein
MSDTAGIKMTIKAYDSSANLFSTDTIEHTIGRIVTYGYDVPSSGLVRRLPSQDLMGTNEEIMISYGILKKIEIIATEDGILDFTVCFCYCFFF